MRSHSVANEGRRIAYQQRARSVLPANDLDRTRWPSAATEASAIQAADWQPKMCGILSGLRFGSPTSRRGYGAAPALAAPAAAPPAAMGWGTKFKRERAPLARQP